MPCVALAQESPNADIAARLDGIDQATIHLDRLVQTWSRRLHRHIALDQALQRVARQNSQALAELPDTAPEGASAYLRFLLKRQGVKDAVVHGEAFNFEDQADLASRLQKHLSRRAMGGGFTHYGIGLAPFDPPSGVATLVLLRRKVEIRSIDAIIGKKIRICGRLLSGINPQVLVTLPGGRVVQRRSRTGSRFCATFPPAHLGQYQVEIMLDGPYGPEVAALFPLYIGTAPPDLPVHKVYPEHHRQPHLMEAQLIKLLNSTRAKAGLQPLEPSRPLQRVARDHSSDMLTSGFFGHISPERGSLTKRLLATGLQYHHASENLALSTGPGKAHDSLMNSPSHRRTLLDPWMTHVGMGVAQDPEQGLIYVTQCLARLKEE